MNQESWTMKATENVISIRLTGGEAEAFAEATEAFPGLSFNHAGRLAAHLFVLMAQEQPDWIPEAVLRLRRAQTERRRQRRARRPAKDGGSMTSAVLETGRDTMRGEPDGDARPVAMAVDVQGPLGKEPR